MKNAIKYVLTNAQHHYANACIDECSSLVQSDAVAPAKGYLLARASKWVSKLLL